MKKEIINAINDCKFDKVKKVREAAMLSLNSLKEDEQIMIIKKQNNHQ